VSGSANPNDRSPQKIARAGRQHACTFDTLILSGVRAFDLKTGSGLSSNDGRASNPKPARSDGLDNVDGGPDAAFYIQLRVIQQVSI
jgi:hypothetical protein